MGGRKIMNISLTLLPFLLACGLSSLGAVDSNDLKAGAAAVKITPPVGINMAGYYFDRAAEGTHDDLYSKALVIEQSGTRVALVTLDLISTTRPMVEAARQQIERATGLRGDHVMISATHAHTGPVLSGRGAREAAQGAAKDISERYSSDLPKLIAESVRLAVSRLEPARAAAVIGREEHLSFNRRFFMRDGTVGWNPGKLNPAIVRPAGPIDPDVGVIYWEALHSNKTALATYVNFAMHPDTVGGLSFSADYPGTLSRLLGDYKGSNMVTLFANGTCGNINHVDVNWANPQKGPAEASRIGTILSAAVLQSYKQLQPVKLGPLRSRTQMVKLGLPEIKAGDIAKARAIAVRYGTKDEPKFLEKVEAFRTLDVAAREGRPQEVEVQVIALGNEIAWVSLPGEIFVELGLAIKKASPFRYTMIAELANGSIGYIPDRKAYAEGNYEPVSARCAAGSGEQLVETALRLLNELH
jgi:neutral ceramidase